MLLVLGACVVMDYTLQHVRLQHFYTPIDVAMEIDRGLGASSVDDHWGDGAPASDMTPSAGARAAAGAGAGAGAAAGAGSAGAGAGAGAMAGGMPYHPPDGGRATPSPSRHHSDPSAFSHTNMLAPPTARRR